MSRQTQLTFKKAPSFINECSTPVDRSFTRHFRTEHGGSLYKGKRKEARPLATKKPIHLVLRSTRARGEWSFLHFRKRHIVEKLIHETALRFDVKVQKLSNSGNHLHLIIQGKILNNLRAFLRTLPALLARAITGAKKGNPVGKFWDAPIYTRLVTWGRELRTLKCYLLRNDLEAIGFISRSNRTLSFSEALARRGIRFVR